MTSDPVQIDHPFSKNVFTLFVQRAREFSDKVAVISEDESVNYGELAARAVAIGEYLAQRVTHEQTIGVFTTRSVDMIAALLGIWKAGCAYVPIDPNDPPEHIQRVLAIANCEIVLSHPELTPPHAMLDSKSANRVIPEFINVREIPAPNTTSIATVPPGGRSLAYVIFTSGSSGVPKGVEVEHLSLANFLYACRDVIEFTASDCFLAVTTIGFDVSVAEIFIPLISGGTILLRSQDILLKPERLVAEIKEFNVTVFQAVASVWSLILSGHPNFPKLRVLINMGEAISNELASKLIPHGEQIWNLYGPTEATVYVSAHRITRTSLDIESGPGFSVPIGRPLANMAMAILDADGKPVAPGERGELYIGGSAVARGYRNEPELTHKAFVQFDPSIGRMYRTGDITALREDGEYLFFGRNDDQLKIRGVRIEPGEIRAALLEHLAVVDVVVTWFIKEDKTRSVVAAIVIESGHAIDAVDLRDWLSLRLRSQMVPEVFLNVQSLPRLPNGKIDYGQIRDDALKLVSESGRSNLEQEPTVTESKLIGIWKNVLDVSQIGVTDNFLAIGGDSLAAMRMILHIEQDFGTSLSIRDIFENLQLDRLAARIDGEGNQNHRASFIFPLHEIKDHRPIFFIDVDFRIAAEGRWKIDCPLFGIANWAQESEFLKTNTIADLARTHTVAIRQIQAFGPYRIAGQGFGGVVALETAQQLERQGQEVELLFLLDPQEPGKVDAGNHLDGPTSSVPTPLQWLRDWLMYNRLSNWFTYQAHHVGLPRNTNPAAAKTLPRSHWPVFWGKERRMSKSYIAKAYAGHVLAFFKASNEAYRAWAKVFGSEENLHILPVGQTDICADGCRVVWMSALDAFTQQHK